MRQTNPFHRTIYVTLIGLLSLMPTVDAAQAQTGFEGKTIHFVVNFSAGGAVDSFFRLVAPVLTKHVPGNPRIVIENRAGAGGRLAASYLYNVAKPDGFTIGGMAGLANDFSGTDDAKYNLSHFVWIGAVPQSQVIVARKDLGIKSPTDFASKQIILAEVGNNFIGSALAFRMMGAHLKRVSGYPGQANTIQAIRQGEANVTDIGAPFFLPNREAWKREGVFDAILQRGDVLDDDTFARSPLFPDLPTLPEIIAEVNPKAVNSLEYVAYRMIAASYSVQYAIIAPPNLPAETNNILRKALADTFADPEMITTLMEKLQLSINFIPGLQAAARIEKMRLDVSNNPAALNLLRDMSNQK